MFFTCPFYGAGMPLWHGRGLLAVTGGGDGRGELHQPCTAIGAHHNIETDMPATASR